MSCSYPAIADGREKGILRELFEAVGGVAAGEAAAALLTEFGSLARVLGAGPEAHARVLGGSPNLVRCLALVKAAMVHSLSCEIRARPVLSNLEALLGYLRVSMAHEPREHVRVLYLNTANRLLQDEVLTYGTISSAELYPREIMRRALELGATALILVHNHPSGDPTPSRSDVTGTRAVEVAARSLGITLHDHLVIAADGHASMRQLGLL
jgi:DNA repair protein RadC